VQSDCESLFLQFSHDVIALRVLWIHANSLALLKQAYCS
jgi:hypothetical protein